VKKNNRENSKRKDSRFEEKSSVLALALFITFFPEATSAGSHGFIPPDHLAQWA
jgi:hypothetical protein